MNHLMQSLETSLQQGALLPNTSSLSTLLPVAIGPPSILSFFFFTVLPTLVEKLSEPKGSGQNVLCTFPLCSVLLRPAKRAMKRPLSGR